MNALQKSIYDTLVKGITPVQEETDTFTAPLDGPGGNIVVKTHGPYSLSLHIDSAFARSIAARESSNRLYISPDNALELAAALLAAHSLTKKPVERK